MPPYTPHFREQQELLGSMGVAGINGGLMGEVAGINGG